MKLWVDGAEGSAGATIRAAVREQVEGINRKVVSRGIRAVNALRNAELEVLKGQRSGRVYKKPGTYGRASKATKELMGDYGHKLIGGQLYRASAPGEAPARRTGEPPYALEWAGAERAFFWWRRCYCGRAGKPGKICVRSGTWKGDGSKAFCGSYQRQS